MIVAATAVLVLAFLSGPLLVVGPLLTCTFVVFGVASPIATANVASVRQAVTPERLQGRVTGTMRVVTLGALPVGSLVGGALAEGVGPRPTIVAAAGVTFVGVLWLILSPLWSLRELPAAADAAVR
jgi:predicted MFS family arabinose efflux permease